MKSNDQSNQDKTTHVLEWISHLIQTPILTIIPNQIYSQGYLVTMLTLIDNKYFICLRQLQSPNFHDLLILIEDYIEHVLGQQFKRRLWSDLLKQKSLLQLLSLIMYVAVHSQNKTKFIANILQLSQQAQASIKDIIQQVSSCIEGKSQVNIGEMLNKIQQLQCQNETLQDYINECRERIDEMEEKYRILEHDYYFVENQCLSLKKEKSYVCKQLQLNRYDDFVEKYRILEQDLDDAYEELKYDQSKIKELENTKKDNKARIIGDRQLIEQLNEELKTARGLCRSMRMSSNFQSPLYNQPILTSRTLKQNIPSFNFNLKRNDNDDDLAQRRKLYNFLNNSGEELEQEVQKLRYEVYDLKGKNQDLNEKILMLKEMNLYYKQNSEKLMQSNRQRKNSLRQLQCLYKEFGRQFREQLLSK